MFKAIVLACVIGAPTECVEFHSYIYSETREDCRKRAFEMSRDIGSIANLMPVQWRCQQLAEGMLSQWNQSAPPLLGSHLSKVA